MCVIKFPIAFVEDTWKSNYLTERARNPYASKQSKGLMSFFLLENLHTLIIFLKLLSSFILVFKSNLFVPKQLNSMPSNRMVIDLS